MATTVKLNYIQVTKPHAFVAHVQLSRAPMNAFHVEFWNEYRAVFDHMREWYGDVRAVVLSSALPNVFTAGIDFQDLLPHTSAAAAPTEPARRALALREHILSFQTAISAPERCPVPVIAAVHGVAYGLAIDILTACDVRYAADDAQFSIKEVDVGLAPDIGTLARLPRTTSNPSLAAELVFTARAFSADEAVQLGLVSRVVAGGRDAVVHAALDLARDVARKSPLAIAGAKHLLGHARDHSVADNLTYTAAWNAAMLQTADIPAAVEAVRSKSRIPKVATFEALPLPGVGTGIGGGGATSKL